MSFKANHSCFLYATYCISYLSLPVCYLSFKCFVIRTKRFYIHIPSMILTCIPFTKRSGLFRICSCRQCCNNLRGLSSERHVLCWWPFLFAILLGLSPAVFQESTDWVQLDYHKRNVAQSDGGEVLATAPNVIGLYHGLVLLSHSCLMKRHSVH